MKVKESSLKHGYGHTDKSTQKQDTEESNSSLLFFFL